MSEKSALSLLELNNLVKEVISLTFKDPFWIVAETSDVRVNQNGHCYLEFIQKDKSGKSIVAKARGMIWANTYFLIKSFFEETTKQSFSSELKVLVQVSIQFHELYGYSLTVLDVDPTYTLGDQARNRAEIIRQLTEDGVIDLNKELELPQPLNRIAIISSPTAAGYEDFCNQLENNKYQFKFYTHLFSAIMQGDKTENSVIQALEKIYEHQDKFDAVIIIRGGGATSDLTCFDSYLLAASCAQFPLPIITGIGHERDETVLDLVAHTRAKTPTAVAEFLINCMLECLIDVNDYAQKINTLTKNQLQLQQAILQTWEVKNTMYLRNWYTQQDRELKHIQARIQDKLKHYLSNEEQKINTFVSQLKLNLDTKIEQEEIRLNHSEKYLSLISPQNIISKGYSVTLKNGKLIRNTNELKKGDQLTTILNDGEITSTVN